MINNHTMASAAGTGTVQQFQVDEICKLRNEYKKFIARTSMGNGEYRLTPAADPSPFARCFAIFGLHLVGEKELLSEMNDKLAHSIEVDINSFRSKRLAYGVDLAFDKPYLQLLCFSLSALKVLNKIKNVSLDDHIAPLIDRDISKDLDRAGCLRGVRASGNQAMFIAIVNLYAQQYLNVGHEDRLKCWVDAHLESMNRFGFWGDETSMTHLQFQNGYHQYEIFEYLGVENPKLAEAVNAVASLADCQGHFGIYPGGGGCYDYDAVAILTSMKYQSGNPYAALLSCTAQTLMNERNSDGGFCDSKYMRPINLKNVFVIAKHILNGANIAVIKERALAGLNLLRPKYNKIQTQWSIYSRDWDESNLFDSWFRMLSLARIQLELAPSVDLKWGFIDFPGIGYVRRHH